MLHFERMIVLIDVWVGMRPGTRLVLAGMCATGALIGFVHGDKNWISLLILAAVVMAPAACGAWRN